MTQNSLTKTNGSFLSKIKVVLSWIKKHKISALCILFTLNLLFYDKNNFIVRSRYNAEISELQDEIKKYQKEYTETKQLLDELNSNPETIEKIAREKYFMKKPNEDIYIIE